MINPLENAGLFLIQTIFDLYIFILLLRVLLQSFGASFHNPISQFIAKLTNPLVNPLSKLLPRVKAVDVPCLLIALIVEVIKFTLMIALAKGVIAAPLQLLALSLVDIITTMTNVFFFGILIIIIINWVNPGLQSPVIEILDTLTRPLLRPAQRLIPPIGGFDISPIPVMIGLKLINIILAGMLYKMLL